MKENNKLITDDYLSDKSDRTSLVKDRVIPNLKAKAYGLSGATIGAAAGAGLGLAGRKITRTALKQAFSPKVTEFLKKNVSENLSKSHGVYADARKFKRLVKKPMNALFSDDMAKTRGLIAGATGAAAGAKIGGRTGEVAGNTSRLRELYRKQFGVEPNENEIFDAARLNPKSRVDRSLYKFFYTPESMTKSTFRNNKQLGSIHQSINNSNRLNQNQMTMPRNQFKDANEYSDLIEKTALKILSKEKMKMMADSIKRAEKKVNLGAKYAPIAGGTLAGVSLIGPSRMASKVMVDSDSSNRKIKRRAIETGVIGTGMATGAIMGRNTGDLSKSIYSKVRDPKDIVDKGKKVYGAAFNKIRSVVK